MAGNKIVPGPKDDHYAEPKGTKFERLYLKKKGWANKINNVNKNYTKNSLSYRNGSKQNHLLW